MAVSNRRPMSTIPAKPAAFALVASPLATLHAKRRCVPSGVFMIMPRNASVTGMAPTFSRRRTQAGLNGGVTSRWSKYEVIAVLTGWQVLEEVAFVATKPGVVLGQL